MARPDPFLNMLADIGFLPVRLPRTNIGPLLLLEVSGKDLNVLGDLPTTMTPGDIPLPVAKPDASTAGSIQGSRTSRMNLNIGVELLTGLVSALAGTSLNIKSAYNQADTLRFEFTDVLVERIDVTQLDGFLNRATIRPEMQHVNRLFKDGKISVVTATLKSGKFVIAAQDENGVDIPVDIPAIQNAVSGKIAVKTEAASDAKVVYEGTTPVVFGVQAVRLFFDEGGKYTLFKSLRAGAGAVRQLGATPRPDDIEAVTVDGIFANLVQSRPAHS